MIDKSNSNLPDLISLPPETINYSGTAVITSTVKDNGTENYAIGANRLRGSLEIDVPMDLSLNNLQFKDTVNNFIKDNNGIILWILQTFSCYELMSLQKMASRSGPLLK